MYDDTLWQIEIHWQCQKLFETWHHFWNTGQSRSNQTDDQAAEQLQKERSKLFKTINDET